MIQMFLLWKPLFRSVVKLLYHATVAVRLKVADSTVSMLYTCSYIMKKIIKTNYVHGSKLSNMALEWMCV